MSSADQPAPSYDELAALVVAQAAQIAVLRAELEKVNGEIEALRAQTKKNSRNSSKPPSSDGLGKPNPRSQRTRTGRKPGGQDGHPGSTLKLVADPHRTVTHEPDRCRSCGDGLLLAPVTAIERRQVVDLPPISPVVTEHRLVERECACCGTRTKADAPEGVDAPVQYGPLARACVLYLYTGQFLAKDRTAEAMGELFGIPLSAGTVVAIQAEAAATLDKEFFPLVRRLLADAPVLGVDETGLRVAGKLHWVHCARTEKYTLVVCHPRRGGEGISYAQVVPGFTGTLVHDCWSPYDVFVDAEHQLCCAHAARELVAVIEASPTGRWCWATQALEMLVGLQRLAADARATGRPIDQSRVGELRHLFRSAVQTGISTTQARMTKLMRKHNNLARRLAAREADYLRFLTNPAIPPDNNGSERDIRMVKLRQKISGCLRTLTGARQFCALRSYLSTAAKHGVAMLHTLARLAEGRPWLPENTPPVTAAA